MQDPQSYEDDAGNVYVREGNRYRVVRAGQAQAAPPAAMPPAAMPPVSGPPGLVPMETPQLRAQTEERQYDRGRDAVRDQLTDAREARAIAAAERQAEAQRIANEKLTEDQGKAGGYAQLMADAERSYQQALSEGFNPTGFRAGLANFTDNIPLMGGVGNFIRDDAGDRARQAELQWSDAQLKAMSGAASPEPEVVRNQITNFARPGQNYGYIGERLEDARRTAFESARRRAGRDLQGLAYPNTDAGELPIRDLLPDETPESLAASGRVRGADGVWRYPRDEQGNPIIPEDAPGAGPTGGAGGNGPTGGNPPAGGGDNGGLLSLFERAGGADVAGQVLGGQAAFSRSALEQVPFGDELMAGFAGVMSGQGYDRMREAQQALTNYDRQNNRFERNMGGVAGAVAQLPVGGVLLRGANIARAGAAAPRIEQMARFGLRATQNAGLGAAGAGVYAAGAADGGTGERLAAGGNALATGAVLGAAAPYLPGAVQSVGRFADDLTGNVVSRGAGAVRDFVGQGVGRLGNALGVEGSQELIARSTPNALTPLADRLSDRLGPARVNALGPRADALRAEGIAPTLVDALDDGGRGLVRAAASRQTPGRDAVREFADGRAAGLQDRLSTQARRTISDDPRSPLEMRSEISARRSAEGDAAFGAVRGEMVTPEPAVIQALRTPAGRAAIEDAAVRAANRGDIETANGLRQLADGALDDPNGVQMTVGMADRIARTLNGRGEALRGTDLSPGDNDAAGALFAQAEALRGTARRQVPGYDAALTAYGDDSRLIQATALGEQFMSMEADQFAAAMARLSPEERQIAQAAARRAVERQAGTQGQAPGVAQRLSNGREQTRRTEALVGDAAPVQSAMSAELQALRNARDVDPRGGSQSSLNLQDAGNLAGMGEIAQDAQTVIRNPISGTMSVLVNRYTSRGFSNAEAEQLARLSVDESRTAELIDLLSARMTRREARNLARSARYQALATTQSGQQQPE